MASTKITPCKFFAHGLCRNEKYCDFAHERKTSTQNRFGLLFSPAGSRETGYQPNHDLHRPTSRPKRRELSPSTPRLPCKTSVQVSLAACCQKCSCPFLHTRNSYGVRKGSNLGFELNDGEERSYSLACEELSIDTMNRSYRTKCVMTIWLFSGASVCFTGFGHILKASLLTDYSLACITGLRPGITPEAIVNIIRGLGFNFNVDCVRSLGILHCWKRWAR
jgi:hypothetical protein